jgi:hypothetical protein
MKSRPRRPRAAVLLALLASSAWLLPPSPARAWGRLGHRASSDLAMTLLTPSARAAVADLLAPGETLADASTWADEIRRDRRETGPWHYVNVPIANDHYDKHFCEAQEGGCVVSKAEEMKALLADPKRPREERREALRFLVHFLQDLHQPLHVGENADKGGNDLQVQFFGQGSNLHRVWDSGLLEQVSPEEAAWAARLQALATPENVRKWSSGTIENWAEESFQASKTRAYKDPSSGQRLTSGAKLGRDYQDANLSVAEARLAQSGVRVAATLNRVFP